METLFVINPVSGRGLTTDDLNRLRDEFKARLGDFNYVLTQSAQDVEEQTRKALESGVEQIVVLGGDGTLNWAMNGFFSLGSPINPNAVLNVAKWGTGSDYFRTVINQKRGAKWRDIVADFQSHKVDIGQIEYFVNGEKKIRYFINACSIGISALVAKKKNESQLPLPRFLAYLPPTISASLSFKSFPATVEIDGVSSEMNLMAIFGMKGLYCGGGMKFGGQVDLDDGFLGLTIIPAVSATRILASLPHIYAGNWEKVPEAKRQVAKKITVTAPKGTLFECDGEVFGEAPVTISVLNQAIQVAFPK